MATSGDIMGALAPLGNTVADPTAVRYILRGYHWESVPQAKGEKMLEMTFGRGLAWAPSGEIHQRQREIVNPAFSAPQIRAFLPVFQNSASEIWNKEVVSVDQPIANVMAWLSRATLDNIGEAGFGFQFGSLDGLENSLREQNEKVL
ncbi:cytochrome P450 [Lactarius quietus]|nr:cytochrome P450 [Lactarius quietus]